MHIQFLGATGTVTGSSHPRPVQDPLARRPPVRIARTDFLLVESTCGNRRHDGGDALAALGSIIRETIDAVKIHGAYVPVRAQVANPAYAETCSSASCCSSHSPSSCSSSLA